MEVLLPTSGSIIGSSRLRGAHVCRSLTERRGGQTPSQMLEGAQDLAWMVADTQGKRMWCRSRRHWGGGGVVVLGWDQNALAWGPARHLHLTNLPRIQTTNYADCDH
eukprot:1161590-Pelagomonas_calceolata.AAC.13